MESKKPLCKNCGVWEETAPGVYCDVCGKAYEEGYRAGYTNGVFDHSKEVGL